MPERLVKQHRHYWEDAEHLLQMAREYEAKVGEGGSDRHGRYYDYWKFRLARMSFIARMLAIEALLNNALEVYGREEKYVDLPTMARSFPHREKFPKIPRKRRGHPLPTPLKWKLYFTPYLCRADSVPERDRFFEYAGGIFAQFTELIAIRNEFVHARLLTDTTGPLTEALPATAQPRPLQEMVFDRLAGRLNGILGDTAGPLCFQLSDAEICRRIMFDTIRKLDEFLEGRILDPRFWDAEEIVHR